MTITLYELAGREGLRFSPPCIRVVLALKRKGLAFERVPMPFTGIGAIGDGGFKTVPVLEDGGVWLRDSQDIVEHLEEAYPDAPTLFGGEGGGPLGAFVRAWGLSTLSPQLMRMVAGDVYASVVDVDRDYFRKTREARLSAPFDRVAADREDRVEPFRASLAPLRQRLEAAPYLGGDAPLDADHAVAGILLWAFRTSPWARANLLAEDDPVRAWALGFDALA
ncbi:MAG: glutathione S-transferase N-terminal domain-containing protein [Geminicoccaceae bacterium]|nr:glutathione S-transferase N-terminal domain-containing protein [Geminicoccaceae bacterium]